MAPICLGLNELTEPDRDNMVTILYTTCWIQFLTDNFRYHSHFIEVCSPNTIWQLDWYKSPTFLIPPPPPPPPIPVQQHPHPTLLSHHPNYTHIHEVKIVSHKAPSRNGHLCQTWNQSGLNKRYYRAGTREMQYFSIIVVKSLLKDLGAWVIGRCALHAIFC